MLEKIAKYGFFGIRIITGILAVIFFLYSILSLWDMYRTEIKAFASYDLLKYRPNIENDEPPYLDELVEINPDTAAWLTIYGTNIDYPVMHGETDSEYLNKTALGDYSISGSIFMATRNSKDFSDPYTLIYGHHMANGSMFGDIEKFKNKAFFYNIKNKRFKTDEGVLIMENVVYNLKVFAMVDTNAYDRNIYLSDKTDEEYQEFLEYARTKSLYYRDVGEIDKVLALSTCYDATTDGRMVLLCKADLRTEPLPTREAEPLTPHRKAQGHPMAGAYWGLLNLVSLLLTAYFVIRATLNRRKQVMAKNPIECRMAIIETLLLMVSLSLFIITEDLHKPIQLVDAWTLPMILILILIYGLEIYRGRRAYEKNQ